MKICSKFKAILAIGTSGLLAATGASAAPLLYNDFSSTSGLQLNGAAAQAGSALRLTPSVTSQSGSVFSTAAVSLASDASFSSAFRFQITQSGGICDEDGCGADGLVFAVQTVSNTAGGAGGGIGYSGLNRSVGVEFDTWNNGGWDNYNGNHVGIDLNGNIDSVVQANVSTAGGNRMNNGAIWSAWVDYNGVTDSLEVRLAQGAAALRPLDALLAYTVDLTGILQSTDAFVGFTSGTGSAYGNHDILAWQFNSAYQPIEDIGDVPEPGTLALVGVGLTGLMIRRRKQNTRA
jgi:hypothetical protein